MTARARAKAPKSERRIKAAAPIAAAPPKTVLSGMDHDTSECVASHLANISDLLGEYVALNGDERGYDTVKEAFELLFKLRLELGFFGGQVTHDLVAHAVDPHEQQKDGRPSTSRA